MNESYEDESMKHTDPDYYLVLQRMWQLVASKKGIGVPVQLPVKRNNEKKKTEY